MEDLSISELPELTDLADADLLEVVDVSEPDPNKKNKKILAGNLGTGKFKAYTTSAGLNSLAAGTDLDNVSLLEAFKKATSRPFAELGVSISVNNTLFEEGATGTVTVSGSIAPNDETTITNRRVLKNGQPWQTFTGTSFSFPDTLTGDTTYTVEATGGTGGLKSATASVNFDLLHRFGPAASVPTAASARDLSGSAWRDGGNAFTLNTGTAEKKFYILLAPSETLTEVKDEDASFAPVTYALLNSNFSVNNAAGVPVAGYKLYELANSVPYSSNHRHNITIA